MAVDRLATSLVDVKAWLRASQLRLNPTVIHVMWLDSSYQLSRLHVARVRVLSSPIPVQDTARDLGVVDSWLSHSGHAAAIFRGGYYQLRQLRTSVRSLSEDARRILVQVFVFSRMNYCNTVLFGSVYGLIRRVQLV